MRKGVRFCLRRPKLEIKTPPFGMSQYECLLSVYEQRKAYQKKVAEFERRLCRAGGKG